MGIGGAGGSWLFAVGQCEGILVLGFQLNSLRVTPPQYRHKPETYTPRGLKTARSVTYSTGRPWESAAANVFSTTALMNFLVLPSCRITSLPPWMLTWQGVGFGWRGCST